MENVPEENGRQNEKYNGRYYCKGITGDSDLPCLRGSCAKLAEL